MNPQSTAHIFALTTPDSGMDGLNYANMAPGVCIEDISVEENARTGSETTYSYGGTYTALKVQQNYCRSWGAYNMALKRKSGGKDWQLIAVFPLNEYNTDIIYSGNYELDVEMNQPSVYSNPVLRGTKDAFGNVITAALLPDNYIAAVARVVENFEAGYYSMTNTSGTTPVTDAGWSAAVADIKSVVPTTSNYQARALQLFATVAAHKTEAYIEYYHVFKRTLTAALPIQVQASNIGKGQIFTTAEMSALENVNPNGFFQLDTQSQWLKSPPVITTAARQKTQVTYNYTEFRQANGLLYVPYNSAILQYASPTDLPPGTT